LLALSPFLRPTRFNSIRILPHVLDRVRAHVLAGDVPFYSGEDDIEAVIRSVKQVLSLDVRGTYQKEKEAHGSAPEYGFTLADLNYHFRVVNDTEIEIFDIDHWPNAVDPTRVKEKEQKHAKVSSTEKEEEEEEEVVESKNRLFNRMDEDKQ